MAAATPRLQIGDVVTVSYYRPDRVKLTKRISLDSRVCFFLEWCLLLMIGNPDLSAIRQIRPGSRGPWWAVLMLSEL
jgi:hypothetical protein